MHLNLFLNALWLKCDKAVNRYFLIFDSIPDRGKKVVFEDPFFIVYCPNKYKNQRTCDETIDDSLAALKLNSVWFCYK